MVQIAWNMAIKTKAAISPNTIYNLVSDSLKNDESGSDSFWMSFVVSKLNTKNMKIYQKIRINQTNLHSKAWKSK